MKCRCAALSTCSEWWPPGDCHAATAGTSGSTRGSGGPGGARSVCSVLSDAPRVIAPVLPPAAAACIAAESTGAARLRPAPPGRFGRFARGAAATFGAADVTRPESTYVEPAVASRIAARGLVSGAPVSFGVANGFLGA